MVAVAVADPLRVGQGIGGGGMTKPNSKSKSKSKMQSGLQESPVCVDVIFNVTATSAAGAAPQSTPAPALMLARAVAEPFNVGQGMIGAGMAMPNAKSNRKSNAMSQTGLHGSSDAVVVTIKSTFASNAAPGSPPHSASLPEFTSVVALARAVPCTEGQGTAGGGIRKSKPKSKSNRNSQSGWHGSPVSVVVTFNATSTATDGCVVHVTPVPADSVAVAVADPPIVGQGTAGGGITKSNRKSKSNSQIGIDELTLKRRCVLIVKSTRGVLRQADALP